MVSQNKARVLSSIAAAMALGSSKSTSLADQPNLRIVLLNCWIVPPYSLFEATTLVPGCISGNSAMIWAA